MAGRSEDNERLTPGIWLLLAAGYIVFSMLGLIMRPTYAGSIVIPRGLGIGMAVLMVMGPRFWPSMLVWATVAGGLLNYTAAGQLTGTTLMRDSVIALMQTAEAVAGAALLCRMFGFPLRVTDGRKVLAALILIGPLLCSFAAEIGIMIESTFGLLPASNAQANWAIWMVGDILGLILALPLALFWPRRGRPWIYWKSNPLPRFTPASAAGIICLACVTLGGWKLLDQLMVTVSQRDFNILVQESDLALSRRLNALQLTVNAVRAISRDAAHVHAATWETAVRSLDLPGKAPGLQGVGLVAEVPRDALGAFVAAQRAAGHLGMVVAASSNGAQAFVITHYLPLSAGADLKRWAADFKAADFVRSRQSGQTLLNGPHNLPGPGEATTMLISPVSAQAKGEPGIFRGWIVMPLKASNIIADQTRRRAPLLHTTAFSTAPNGVRVSVFDDSARARQAVPSLFSTTDTRDIFGQNWTIHWQSTPRFEAELNRTANGVVLLCGMAFVYLAGFYLLSLAGRERAINKIVSRRTLELAEQIEENRSIIQTPSANIVTLDRQGTILFCNDSAARVFGCDTDEITGRPLCNILGQETAELVAKSAAQSEQVLLQREVRIRNFAGVDLVLDVQISSWQTPSGDGRYTVLLTDITELVESKEALRASEEQFRSAIRAAPVAMAIVDRAGRFLQLNASLVALSGRSEEALLCTNFRRILNPADRDRIAELIPPLESGQLDSFEVTARCLRADGSEIWTRMATAAIRDSEGNVRSYVVQILDIDEQMMLDRTKNEFISTVSHELRTPLTSINGSLALLLNGLSGEMPAKARNMLEIAHRNAERLIRLVNDILDLDKLAAEQMRFEVSSVEPGMLVQQSVDEITPFAAATGISVRIERTVEGAAALLDPNRFLQVMANLLSNAIKFSPTDGVVTVRVETDEGRLIVSVTDHGPGVPVAFRRRIFSAFSQADASPTRSKQGSGLGLHISKTLVERMNGKIGFSSEPDTATTFWVSFPLLVTGLEAPLAQPAER